MNGILPDIDETRCNGCGECVTACPESALALVSSKVRLRPDAACTYCTECERVCPAGAIRCPFEILMGQQAKTLI